MTQFTEAQAQRALAQYFDWSKRPVFINSCVLSWEMDVAVLTTSNYLWEVEIKVSLADWRQDQFKDKWKARDIGKISRLYYAVPWTLLGKVPEFVGDHIGLIGLYVAENGKSLRARLHREALTKKGAQKLSDAEVLRMYRSTYFKYWGKIVPAEAKGEPECYIDSEPESPDSSPPPTTSSWEGRSPVSPIASPQAGKKPKSASKQKNGSTPLPSPAPMQERAKPKAQPGAWEQTSWKSL